MKQPTCQDCICCSSLIIRYELCKQLRRQGACLVQNSQRVIVIVAPQVAASDIKALVAGNDGAVRVLAER